MNRSDITGTSTYSFYSSTITSKLSVKEGYVNTKYVKLLNIELHILVLSNQMEQEQGNIFYVIEIIPFRSKSKIGDFQN